MDIIQSVVMCRQKLKGVGILSDKRKVIVVTDGDKIAKKTVEVASGNLGLRCISMSWGNPTPLKPQEAVDLLLQAPRDPVVIMVDDRGDTGEGQGEQVLRYLAESQEIEIIGVVAVASNTPCTQGVDVDYSITKDGSFISGTVDKEGIAHPLLDHHLDGDTVDVLNQINVPIIIGIGDVGKMNGCDDYRKGAPRTTQALQKILERNGFKSDYCR